MPDRVHGHSAALTRHSNGTIEFYDAIGNAEADAHRYHVDHPNDPPNSTSVAVYKLVAVHARFTPPQPAAEIRRFEPDEDLS